MNNSLSDNQRRKPFLRTVPLVLGLMMTPSHSALAQTPYSEPTGELNANFTLPGGPISLNEVALITLKNSPNIQMGMMGVESSRAGYRMQRGAFDFITSVVADIKENRPAVAVLGADQDTQDLTGVLIKNFRTGISSTLSVGITRTDNRANPEGPPDTLNVAHANFNLTLPLLKGRGSISAAADETAARLESQASELQFYHDISNFLLAAINAYWDYKAAVEKLKVQKTAEQRVQKWYSETGAALQRREGSLERVNQKYAAEISRLKGYLATKRQNTLAATEQVTTTKGALAIVMGIPSGQVANLGEPSEDFPLDWSEVLATLERQPMQDKWKAVALEKRFDIQATKLKQEASATNLAKARRDVLPQLDLGLSYGYNGIELGDGFERYTDSLTSDTRGADWGATLTLTYPLGNNFAQGNRDLANAAHQMSLIQTKNLVREIGVNVEVDAGVLMRRLKVAVEAGKAVDSYSPALKQFEHAHQSLVSDPHTIFSLLDIEERLTEAEIRLVDSLQQLAKAIAQLRFKTGTLIAGGEFGKNINISDLTTLPGM